MTNLLDPLRFADNVKVLDNVRHANIPEDGTVLLVGSLNQWARIARIQVALDDRATHLPEAIQLVNVRGNV